MRRKYSPVEFITNPAYSSPIETKTDPLLKQEQETINSPSSSIDSTTIKSPDTPLHPRGHENEQMPLTPLTSSSEKCPLIDKEVEVDSNNNVELAPVQQTPTLRTKINKLNPSQRQSLIDASNDTLVSKPPLPPSVSKRSSVGLNSTIDFTQIKLEQDEYIQSLNLNNSVANSSNLTLDSVNNSPSQAYTKAFKELREQKLSMDAFKNSKRFSVNLNLTNSTLNNDTNLSVNNINNISANDLNLNQISKNNAISSVTLESEKSAY